jgi:hypothetical protein
VKHTIEIELPDGAVVSHGYGIVAFFDEDGESQYALQSTGMASMTAFLGLSVLAERDIYEWKNR